MITNEEVVKRQVELINTNSIVKKNYLTGNRRKRQERNVDDERI